jgi:hypothetical protein
MGSNHGRHGAVAAASVLLAACSSAPVRPSAAAAAPLPPGLAADCFVAARCDATGDLDADGAVDRVELVGGAAGKGLAIRWGSGAAPTILGAGTTLAVVRFGDDLTAATPRSAGEPDALDPDLSYLASWDVLPAVDGAGGSRALDGFDFLPGVHGDALRLSGGDAAWVLYRTADGTWYYAPLGY